MAEEDDMDHDAQMAALKVVQGQEEATSYPPLKGHKMKKGVFNGKAQSPTPTESGLEPSWTGRSPTVDSRRRSWWRDSSADVLANLQ